MCATVCISLHEPFVMRFAITRRTTKWSSRWLFFS